MARRGSALERASAAINRGSSSAARKSALDSDFSDDAAELTRFLSGLSGTSRGGDKSSGAVPAGLSDISISSDEDFNSRVTSGPPAASLISGANKFMKSSKPTAAQSKHLPVKSASANTAAVNQSPALLRLSQQTQRFLNKSKTSAGVGGSNSLHISEDSTIVSETSESIGAGGNKFLKSKQTKAVAQPHVLEAPKRQQNTPLPAHSLRTSTEDDSDMAAYIQKLSPSASEVSDADDIRSKPPLFSLPQPSAAADTKYESSFATETFSAESSIVSDVEPRRPPFSKSMDSTVSIATEDAPLATTLMGIEELSLSPVPAATSKHLSKSATKSSATKSSATKSSATKSSATKSSAPLKSDKKAAKQTFSSFGLQSVDDLLATPDSSIRSEVPSGAQKSIQTESSIRTYDSVRSSTPRSESSIHTYRDSVRTVSIDSEIHTHSTTKVDDYASDFDDTLRETESIATDSGSRSPSHSDRTLSSPRRNLDRSYSSGSHSSYNARSRSVSRSYSRSKSSSSRRSSSRSRSSRKSQSSRSRSRSRSHSTDQSWSPGHSRSPSVSRSRTTPRSTSQSSSRRSMTEKSSVNHDYSSSFEDHLESTQEVRPSGEKVDAQVQTGLELDEMILKYYWSTDQAVPFVAASQQTKASSEPAKVAGMAVSNDALEALTLYNPSLLALNDMIKQQVQLSRQFLNMQQDMHKSIMGSIEREHVYTTLEDTYKYIKSRRKPRLTFDQAVDMVKEEMNL